jgi:hypothetical protein
MRISLSITAFDGHQHTSDLYSKDANALASSRQSIDQSALAKEELATLTDSAMDANWNLQKYFGQIKVISSNTQSNRFKRFQQELKMIGLTPQNYEVVPGVDGSKLDRFFWNRMVKWDKNQLTPNEHKRRLQGQAGCVLAHYNAIINTITCYKAAKEILKKVKADSHATSADVCKARNQVRKFSSLVIFEDNAGVGKVTGNYSADIKGYGRLFRSAMKDLKDWDMFYFMSTGNAKKISSNLAKLEYGLITKCYAINARVYDKILKVLSVVTNPNKKIKPIDHILAGLHEQTNSFVSTPPLFYRFASVSEVGANLGNNSSKPPTNWQSNVEIKE